MYVISNLENIEFTENDLLVKRLFKSGFFKNRSKTQSFLHWNSLFKSIWWCGA